MYPNENTIINDIQRGTIKKEDVAFVCQAVQHHFKNLRQVGAIKDSVKKEVAKVTIEPVVIENTTPTIGELSKMSKDELVGLGIIKGITVDASFNKNELIEKIIKG